MKNSTKWAYRAIVATSIIGMLTVAGLCVGLVAAAVVLLL